MTTSRYYHPRRHFVLGQYGRFTACGQEAATQDVVRREAVDLVALVAVTCRVCKRSMRAQEEARVR